LSTLLLAPLLSLDAERDSTLGLRSLIFLELFELLRLRTLFPRSRFGFLSSLRRSRLLPRSSPRRSFLSPLCRLSSRCAPRSRSFPLPFFPFPFEAGSSSGNFDQHSDSGWFPRRQNSQRFCVEFVRTERIRWVSVLLFWWLLFRATSRCFSVFSALSKSAAGSDRIAGPRSANFGPSEVSIAASATSFAERFDCRSPSPRGFLIF
jgi:hypothetical protein